MNNTVITPKFSRTKEAQSFFNTLNERIYQYFKAKNISRTGNMTLYIKTAVMLIVYSGAYLLLLLLPMNIWMQLLLCIVTGIGMAGVGMNVMHDGNHGSYSSIPWVNKIMGGTMYLLAGNARNWKVQHNVLHHTYTNIQGHDEDLDSGRILRFSKYSIWRHIHRYQHIYSVLLYGLLTLNWCLTTDFFQSYSYFKRGLFPGSSKLWHWSKLIFFKLLYFFIWIALPMIVMENPWWHILIGFVVIHYTAGLILSLIFQLAHVIDKVEVIKPSDDSKAVMKNSWAMHQLFTTANFAPNHPLISWYTGGLNHQIEHHLFPNICHVHYQKISNIVKQTAIDFELPYNEYRTMGNAISCHFRHLRSLGLGDKVK